eukprot:TRINITY_DN16073_c0_g1_i1.p1 TRINITY_DN16073_c0_g1~~TRINITY_DN16073_c0_g1_i1.p1  ORF type:complete len:392 (+),score=53.44 TRINITY_DN16073_c0_g1_i1:129-1304(+)
MFLIVCIIVGALLCIAGLVLCVYLRKAHRAEASELDLASREEEVEAYDEGGVELDLVIPDNTAVCVPTGDQSLSNVVGRGAGSGPLPTTPRCAPTVSDAGSRPGTPNRRAIQRGRPSGKVSPVTPLRVTSVGRAKVSGCGRGRYLRAESFGDLDPGSPVDWQSTGFTNDAESFAMYSESGAIPQTPTRMAVLSSAALRAGPRGSPDARRDTRRSLGAISGSGPRLASASARSRMPLPISSFDDHTFAMSDMGPCVPPARAHQDSRRGGSQGMLSDTPTAAGQNLMMLTSREILGPPGRVSPLTGRQRLTLSQQHHSQHSLSTPPSRADIDVHGPRESGHVAEPFVMSGSGHVSPSTAPPPRRMSGASSPGQHTSTLSMVPRQVQQPEGVHL